MSQTLAIAPTTVQPTPAAKPMSLLIEHYSDTTLKGVDIRQLGDDPAHYMTNARAALAACIGSDFEMEPLTGGQKGWKVRRIGMSGDRAVIRLCWRVNGWYCDKALVWIVPSPRIGGRK